MSRPRHHVTVLSRRGCHLCEQAVTDVARIVGHLGDAGAPAGAVVTWEERDITDDADLMADYAEQVPVILVDGRPHDFWRVDQARLQAALGG